MTNHRYTLISHNLCPFVQRAAIALKEKGIAFERRDIDLANKPDWFLELSPLGKVPLLLVDEDTVLFESSVIAEYINEISGSELLATDTLEKSRQRAWIEFASSVIANIGQLYNAANDVAFDEARAELKHKWRTLETNIADGGWFSGGNFSLVDAAFAPAFRYFDVIEPLTGIDFFADTPGLRQWRADLAARPSVRSAVASDYESRLREFLAKRNSIIGKLTQPAAEAAA